MLCVSGWTHCHQLRRHKVTMATQSPVPPWPIPLSCLVDVFFIITSCCLFQCACQHSCAAAAGPPVLGRVPYLIRCLCGLLGLSWARVGRSVGACSWFIPALERVQHAVGVARVPLWQRSRNPFSSRHRNRASANSEILQQEAKWFLCPAGFPASAA